jgi:CubicO group peptidase (beta-lactamase class C family)
MVLDDGAVVPRGRAIGYDSAGGRIRLSDYGAFELASGRRVHVEMRTVGAGGMYATLHDLAAWERALTSRGVFGRDVLDEAFRLQAPATDVAGVDTVTGYGLGWVTSWRYGTDVVWQDGALGGFRNVVIRVPSRRLAVAVLSNAAWIDQRRLALSIADRLVSR